MLGPRGTIAHEHLRPVAAVILSGHPMRAVAERHGCTTPDTPTSLLMSNAIGLILLVCIPYLCCTARLPPCRPVCFLLTNLLAVPLVFAGSRPKTVRRRRSTRAFAWASSQTASIRSTDTQYAVLVLRKQAVSKHQHRRVGGWEADLSSCTGKTVAPDRPPKVSVRSDGSSAASASDSEKVSRQASFVYYLSKYASNSKLQTSFCTT